MTIWEWMVIITILIFYFAPAIIAFNRGHHNAGAIFALNLLLGWTFLGWIASFIWSLTYAMKREDDRIVYVSRED